MLFEGDVIEFKKRTKISKKGHVNKRSQWREPSKKPYKSNKQEFSATSYNV
jgi:hypothetical protein